MTGPGAPRPARIVVLNGVGSVGKSSTARALQAVAASPILHVAMDAFCEMLPRHLIGHDDGLWFEPVPDNGGPCLAVRSGPVMARTMRGMRRAVAAMAEAGSDLVVDDVMVDGGEQADYRALLSRFDLRFVGLHAPLDVLEARERARGDRAIGLARWQFDRVHRGVEYDLELDTTTGGAETLARTIMLAFGW